MKTITLIIAGPTQQKVAEKVGDKKELPKIKLPKLKKV